jgi:hypothetical protein
VECAPGSANATVEQQVVLELIGDDVSHVRKLSELTRTAGRVAAVTTIRTSGLLRAIRRIV